MEEIQEKPVPRAHGDVTKLADELGRIVEDYTYDPYGNVLDSSGNQMQGTLPQLMMNQLENPIDNPFRYAGEYFDEETGNYYLRARYYDPSTQRFISEDSYRGELITPLSLNRYSYCQGNPVMYKDPDGNHRIPTMDPSITEAQYEESLSSNGQTRYIYDREPTERYSNYLRFNYQNPDAMSFDDWLSNNPEYNRTKQEYSQEIIEDTQTGIITSVFLAEGALFLKGVYSSYKMSQYFDDEGEIIWPANDGFSGKPEKAILQPGTRVDRYGFETGKYVSPDRWGFPRKDSEINELKGIGRKTYR